MRAIKTYTRTVNGQNQTISIWPDKKVRTGYGVEDMWDTLTRPGLMPDEEWFSIPVGYGWSEIKHESEVK